MDFKPTRDQLVDFAELIHSLEDNQILITYHGTTRQQAGKILEEGFKSPNLFEILLEAYRITGLTRDVRRSLPPWALEYITDHEIIPRLTQRYHKISFAPHGVASRWSGKRGEVLHETVCNINFIKGFMASSYPKDEASFDEWSEIVNKKDFYQQLGDPIVLKVWVQLDVNQANRILRDLKSLLKDSFIEEAWFNWNFNYRDDRVSDPAQIIRVEIADPPFTGL